MIWVVLTEKGEDGIVVVGIARDVPMFGLHENTKGCRDKKKSVFLLDQWVEGCNIIILIYLFKGKIECLMDKLGV